MSVCLRASEPAHPMGLRASMPAARTEKRFVLQTAQYVVTATTRVLDGRSIGTGSVPEKRLNYGFLIITLYLFLCLSQMKHSLIPHMALLVV